MPRHQLQYLEEEVKPGFNVQLSLGIKETRGDIGIEIEVEGNKFPIPDGYEGSSKPISLPGSMYWSYVHDGSLRGNANAEYVLTKPISFGEGPQAVHEIYGMMAGYGSVLDVSNRTSVHVHLNCQEFHMDRLTTFLCSWFTLEEILTEWCGDHRVGNLFCLRAVDAPAIVSQLRSFIKQDGAYPLSEILRYGGLNPHSLLKYGSLEVRTLRGCTEPEPVVAWLKILQRLYKLSGEYRDPRRLVSKFSQYGPLAFFDFLLGEECSRIVMQGVEWNSEQVKRAMLRGIRFAQDLCYCRNWDVYKTIDLKPDPFGRDLKKVAQKMMLPTSGGTLSPAGAQSPSDALAAAIQAIQSQEHYSDHDDMPEPMPEYDSDYNF